MKSQIWSQWSLTASGVMGLFFCRTVRPRERSQRTACTDTHARKQRGQCRVKPSHTHTQIQLKAPRGLMNIIRGSRSGSAAELTFTDPACATLRDNTRADEQTQTQGEIRGHVPLPGPNSITDAKLNAERKRLRTSNSPPFSWHCSWQSHRTRGATNSGFRA